MMLLINKFTSNVIPTYVYFIETKLCVLCILTFSKDNISMKD